MSLSLEEESELAYYDIGAYDRRRACFRKKAGLAIVAAFVAVLAVMGALQWWEQVRDPSIGSYATTEIKVTGLGSTFTVTPAQLLEMECVWESATGKGQSSSSDGSSVVRTAEVYGPTLETFLAYYGYELKDFSKIKAVCKDDYYVIMRPQKEQIDAVLSIANGKDALLEKQQPLRLVLPSAESSRWAYGVVELQFTKMKTSEDDDSSETTTDTSDLPSILLQGGKD